MSADYIYESPDGGHTVYRRKIGCSERILYRETEFAKDQKKRFEWHSIWDKKDSNPALQKAVERVILIYRLGEKNGET